MVLTIIDFAKKSIRKGRCKSFAESETPEAGNECRPRNMSLILWNLSRICAALRLDNVFIAVLIAICKNQQMNVFSIYNEVLEPYSLDSLPMGNDNKWEKFFCFFLFQNLILNLTSSGIQFWILHILLRYSQLTFSKYIHFVFWDNKYS